MPETEALVPFGCGARPHMMASRILRWGVSEPERTEILDGLAGLVADSRTVAAWTLVSRVTGFGRVATMAAVLGPTYFGNLFQTCVLLPGIIFALLGGSLFAAILVPALVPSIRGRDHSATQRLASGFVGITLPVLSAIVILSILIAPLLLMLITAAVSDTHTRQLQQQIGWPVLAMALPQMLLYSIGATGAAVQQAHGRFALAAAAPAMENIGNMMVLGSSALIFGVSTRLEDVSAPQLLLLGLGTTAAVAVHAAVQWWGAKRFAVILKPGAGWRDDQVRRMIRTAFASSGYTSLYNVVSLAMLVVAGRIPGGAVAFQIGQQLSFLPVALGALPLAAAQLPRLSRSFLEGDMADFNSTFGKSAGLTRFVAVPAALLLLTSSDILARAVAFGPMATATGISMIAACVASLGPGVIGDAVVVVTTSASYARREARAPFRAIALRAAMALVGIALALSLMEGVAVLWTLGASVSLGNLAAAAYLRRSLARDISAGPSSRKSPLLGELASSVIAITPCLLIAVWLKADPGNHYERIGVAVVSVVIAGILYLTVQWMRGSDELKSLSAGILGRGLHRPPEEAS